MTSDTIIVGGGIGGLSLLHRLRNEGKEAILLEKSERLGGVVLTREAPWGGLVDLGPNTLRGASDDLASLIDELELRDRVVAPDPAAKSRFVLNSGRLTEVPSSPRSLLETDLLSVRGKARLLREPFVGKGSNPVESVAAFVKRRFGSEVLDRLVDPLVTGIYAGDPDALSLAATFPLLSDIEQEHRSLLVGALKRLKKRKNGDRGVVDRLPRIFSFDAGIGALVERLVERNRDAIRTGEVVVRIDRVGDRWQVTTSDATYEAASVVLTTDAPTTAGLIETFEPKTAAALCTIVHAPVAVVVLAYDRESYAKIPKGFGVLVPSREKRDVLGVIFASRLFPDRSPEDLATLTVMIGGVRRPELVGRSDEELRAIATEGVASIFEDRLVPVDALCQRWLPGIPQYGTAHRAVVAGIEQCERANPGLRLCGSYRGGVSMADRITPSPTKGA